VLVVRVCPCWHTAGGQAPWTEHSSSCDPHLAPKKSSKNAISRRRSPPTLPRRRWECSNSLTCPLRPKLALHFLAFTISLHTLVTKHVRSHSCLRPSVAGSTDVACWDWLVSGKTRVIPHPEICRPHEANLTLKPTSKPAAPAWCGPVRTCVCVSAPPEMENQASVLGCALGGDCEECPFCIRSSA